MIGDVEPAQQLERTLVELLSLLLSEEAADDEAAIALELLPETEARAVISSGSECGGSYRSRLTCATCSAVRRKGAATMSGGLSLDWVSVRLDVIWWPVIEPRGRLRAGRRTRLGQVGSRLSGSTRLRSELSRRQTATTSPATSFCISSPPDFISPFFERWPLRRRLRLRAGCAARH